MSDSTAIWSYSAVDLCERWDGNCASREEAIAEGIVELGIEPGGEFFVNSGHAVDGFQYMPDAYDLVERANDAAQDECGEVAEDWPDVSKEALAELDEAIKTWVHKHAPTRFHVVDGKAEKITVPKEPS